MWNRRIISIIFTFIFLITLLTYVSFSEPYTGDVINGTVKSGENPKICSYIVKIDGDLNENEFKYGRPQMGVSLTWDQPEADLQMQIFKVSEKEEHQEVFPRFWDRKQNSEGGDFCVRPGEEYKIVVMAKSGESRFQLNLFHPKGSFSSNMTASDHILGNYAFYHFTEMTSANKLFGYALGSKVSPLINPAIYLFPGDGNVAEFNSIQSVSVDGVTENNFVALKKSEGYTGLLQYYLMDQNKVLQPMPVEGRFTPHVAICDGDRVAYNQVQFDPQAQYLILLATDAVESCFSLRLYNLQDTEVLRTSQPMAGGFNVVDLTGLDLTKAYRVEVEGLSIHIPSASYCITQIVEGEFRAPQMKPDVLKLTNSSSGRSDSDSPKPMSKGYLRENWYSVKPQQVGTNRVTVEWQKRKSNTSVTFQLFEGGKRIQTYDANLNQLTGEYNFDFTVNDPNKEYYLRILFDDADCSILDEGASVASLEAWARKNPEQVLGAMVMMYTQGDIQWDQFESWFHKLRADQERVGKYQLLDLMIAKQREQTIIDFPAVYKRFQSKDWTQPIEYVQLMGELCESGVLDVQEYAQLLEEYAVTRLEMNPVVATYLSSRISHANLEHSHFISIFKKYIELNPRDTKGLFEFFTFMEDNNLMEFNDMQQYYLTKVLTMEERIDFEFSKFEKGKLGLQQLNTACKDYNISWKELGKGVILEVGTLKTAEKSKKYYLVIADRSQNSKLRAYTTFKKRTSIEKHAKYYLDPPKEYDNEDLKVSNVFAAVNGGFFNESSHMVAGQVIVNGRDITEGGIPYDRDFPNRIYRYYWGIIKEDPKQYGKNSGKIVFGRLIKNGNNGVIPPATKMDLQWGISGLGGLLLNGVDISGENNGLFKDTDLRATSRTAFGVNQSQMKIYLFTGMGYSNWTPYDVSKLLKRRAVYNAVFMDSGRSTQIWYKVKDGGEVEYGMSDPNKLIPNSVVIVEKVM